MSTTKTPDMWLGLRRCGCPVAACIDDGEIEAKHVEQTKRDFLKDWLQVILVTWAEWQETYRPLFMRECPHSQTRRDGAQEHAVTTAASEAKNTSSSDSER